MRSEIPVLGAKRAGVLADFGRVKVGADALFQLRRRTGQSAAAAAADTESESVDGENRGGEAGEADHGPIHQVQGIFQPSHSQTPRPMIHSLSSSLTHGASFSHMSMCWR